MKTTKLSELDLDRCFWREISTSEPFQQWLLSKTELRGRDLQLVPAGKVEREWHSRWYVDPVTRRGSEGDILLVFVEKTTGKRCALHMENKPAHGRWQPNQAAGYQRRATDNKEKWGYNEFDTVLLAPASFLMKHPVEANLFGSRITYEEVSVFVREFGEAMGQDAIQEHLALSA